MKLLAALAAVVTLVMFGGWLQSLGLLSPPLPSEASAESPPEESTQRQLEDATNRTDELEDSLVMARERIAELESELAEQDDPAQQAGGDIVRQDSLTDSDPIISDGIWDTGPAEVGDVPFAPSLVLSTSSRTAWVEYAVNSEWSSLAASVGLADEGLPDAHAQLTIYTDDRSVAEVEMEAGDAAQDIEVDLADVDRVRIEATKISSRGGLVGVVFGEPTLISY